LAQKQKIYISKLIIENNILKTITASFKRSPSQRNKLLESDAEIIRLRDGTYLAVTVDSIVEEIASGLYTDPYLIGWMTVMASISDLAAVGARPIGILLIENIPSEYPADKIQLIQKGIQEACDESGTFVLGGDTNSSRELQLGAVAVGIIDDEKVISRLGCQENDLLLISHPMGLGMGFALTQLFYKQYNIPYKPTPNLIHGRVVRKYASSCIDTSDGFFPAICNLMELNNIGFTINKEFENFIDTQVVEIAQKANMPNWFFLAGPHGEFELLFTIPPSNLDDFLAEAIKTEWTPIVIGTVINKPELQYSPKGKNILLDGSTISNLFVQSGGDPKIYMQALFKLNQRWALQ
jgi:thiamine-monophosphate kinase